MGTCCGYLNNFSEPFAIKDDFNNKILYIIEENNNSPELIKTPMFNDLNSNNDESPQNTAKKTNKKAGLYSDTPKSLNMSMNLVQHIGGNDYSKSFTVKNPNLQETSDIKKSLIPELEDELLKKISKIISKADIYKKKENSLYKSSSLCSDEEESVSDNDKSNENDKEVIENLSKIDEFLINQGKNTENSEKIETIQKKQEILEKTDKNSKNTRTMNESANFLSITGSATYKSDIKPIEMSGGNTSNSDTKMIIMPRKSLLKSKSIGRNDIVTKKKKVKFKETNRKK